ncbi:MAG: hypothetical protein EOO05_02805 [Chitinophagaceae bacterium]|nr:MAG: hypothetical protein EOO05_02805 [Chitinophagaceae bacterium]
MMTRTSVLLLGFVFSGLSIRAQDHPAPDLLSAIDSQSAPPTSYASATFKTTRLINGHTVEGLGKGVLDFKISHRFGKLNGGGYQLWGLDNATMRMGFDYGITDRILIGIGRSTFEKTFDLFFKVKLLRQSEGDINMPFTVSYIPTMAWTTLKFDKSRKNLSSSRYSYTHQLLIARKFSANTSLQLMPTFVHQNLVPLATDHNNMFAIGVGGRQKITRRTSFNAEYYYQLPSTQLSGSTNSLSMGFDIETGGHVFQLHVTNSQGMTEKQFISNTDGKWGKGDIFFGFNISRVFNVGKQRRKQVTPSGT